MMQQPGGMAPPALGIEQQQPGNAAPVPGGTDEVRSLWIKDLRDWMDKVYLTNCFYNRELISVQVFHHHQFNIHEGWYGFLEFRSRAAAESVMQSYYGVKMPYSVKQTFRLSWASDNTPEHTIFVGNLAGDVTHNILQETFKNIYHSVKGAKLLTDKVGRSKGYGFVKFGDKDEQLMAMQEMNGVICSTRQMRIFPELSHKQLSAASTLIHSGSGRSSSVECGAMVPPGFHQQQNQMIKQMVFVPPPFWLNHRVDRMIELRKQPLPDGIDADRSLFVGNLEPWMDERFLTDCFKNSELVCAKVIRRLSYYGFLEFRSRAAAQRVLDKYPYCFSVPKNVKLFWAAWEQPKRTDNSLEHTIIVRDLARDVTDNFLLETFKNMYQSIKGAKVVKNRVTGQSKGCGIVKFGDEGEQLRAMIEMNGLSMDMRDLVGDVDKADLEAFINVEQFFKEPAKVVSYRQRASLRKTTFSDFFPKNEESRPPVFILPGLGNPGMNLIDLQLLTCRRLGLIWQRKQPVPDGIDADRSLFIGNLCFDEKDITDWFRNTELVSVKLVKYEGPDRLGYLFDWDNHGYGFLEFRSRAAAESVLSKKNNCPNGQLFWPGWPDLGAGAPTQSASYQSSRGSQGASDPNDTTILVGGLDPSVTDDYLKQVFSECGELVHVERCGFVQFADRSCAEHALSTLNGTMLGGQNVRLSWGRNPWSNQSDQGEWARPGAGAGG